MKASLRFPITDEILEEVEYDLKIQRSVQRYLLIRRFCYGALLDFGAGSGFGSKLLAQSPEVESVTPFDIDSNPETLNRRYDTIVALETIEHLETPNVRWQCDNLILSFPDKSTKHYNPYHKHDLTVGLVVSLLDQFVLYYRTRFFDSAILCFVKKPESMPSHIVRNLHELT